MSDIVLSRICLRLLSRASDNSHDRVGDIYTSVDANVADAVGSGRCNPAIILRREQRLGASRFDAVSLVAGDLLVFPLMEMMVYIGDDNDEACAFVGETIAAIIGRGNGRLLQRRD